MRQLLARGGDVALLRPVGGRGGARRRRHRQRRVGAGGGRGRRLRGDADPAPAVPRASRSGITRASSWTRATWRRRGRASARSSCPGCSCSGPGTSARRWPRARSRRGTRSCSPTTGTRPSASSSAGWRSAAAHAWRPPTSATRRTRRGCLPSGAGTACYLLAAQASRPLSERDPDYTEETNLTRRPARGRGGGRRRRRRRSSTAARCTSTARTRGEVGADRPYGRQGDLAHLSKIYAELCLELYARRARLRPGAAAARDRLRPGPGGARRGRSRRRSWTSSAGSRRPARS